MVGPDTIEVKCISNISVFREGQTYTAKRNIIGKDIQEYIVIAVDSEGVTSGSWYVAYTTDENGSIDLDSDHFKFVRELYNEESMEPTVEEVEDTSIVDNTKVIGLDEVLEQRGSRYGDFKFHAEIACELKDSLNTKDLPTYYMREAADMICHKLARIANGDPFYDDSWRDIAGYAQLVVDILNGNEGERKCK